MEHQNTSTQEHSQTQTSQQTTYLTSINEIKKVQNFFNYQLTKNVGSQIYSTEYLTEDMFLALGCTDGAIRVLSTSKVCIGDVQYLLRNIDQSPVSSLAMNPNSSNIKNSVMATHTDGTIEYWHATSQQLLFTNLQYEQFLLCCEISSDGHYYVFAGDQGHLKLGALSKGNPSDLQVGNIGSHDNRVFCLKWNPYDPNIFFSGGWDKTVFIWDVRSKTAVSKLYGIYMGGNAIDVNNKNQLLLGNNQNDHQLRIYDMNAQKVRKVDWKPFSQQQYHGKTGVLSCYFGQMNDEILAATPNRDIRLYKQQKLISLYQGENLQRKIFSLSKSAEKRNCAIGWSNGDIQIFNY